MMSQPVHLAVNAVALAPGGGLTYLTNQARALRDELPGWRMTFFVVPASAPAVAEAVGEASVRVPFRHKPSLVERVRWEQCVLPRLLRDEDVDVLYGIAGFAVWATRVPQLLFNQNPNHHATRRDIGLSTTLAISKVQRAAARWSARRAEMVIYATHAFSHAMAAVGFPPPDDIIPSGVATDWGAATDDATAPEPPFALAVHNWYRHKRLEWLIESWMQDPQLHRRRLVIVGAPVDARTTRRIRKLLAAGAARHVRLVDSATRPQLRGLFARAELYLSASVLEAFPLTPFEAMSAGVPCVLSDIPTHREVAAGAAEYFGPGDVRGLAAAVLRAEGRRDELGRAGHARIEAFPWSANAAAFAAHLEHLVTKVGTTPA